jgi:hypothetical protein
MVTLVAPRNLVPVIVMDVPPDISPEDGETLVTVGKPVIEMLYVAEKV